MLVVMWASLDTGNLVEGRRVRSHRLCHWASLFVASRLLKGGNNLEKNEVETFRISNPKKNKVFTV